MSIKSKLSMGLDTDLLNDNKEDDHTAAQQENSPIIFSPTSRAALGKSKKSLSRLLLLETRRAGLINVERAAVYMHDAFAGERLTSYAFHMHVAFEIGVIRQTPYLETQWQRDCYLIHNKYTRPLCQVCIMVLLLLPFFTRPTWMFTLTNSDNKNYFPRSDIPFLPFSASCAMEAGLLLCLILDAYFQVTVRDSKTFTQIRRLPMLCLLLLICSIEWIVVVVEGPSSPRIAPYLYPALGLVYWRRVRHQFKLLARILPDFLDVMLFITVLVFVFAWIGCLNLESGDRPDYFVDMGEAAWQLSVLLTAANFPDVMMPAYSENRMAVIYFVVYILVGVYLFMNLIFTVVFYTFQQQRECLMHERMQARNVNIEKAFDLLDEEATGYIDLRTVKLLFHEMSRYFHGVSYLEDGQWGLVCEILDQNSEGNHLDLVEFKKIVDVLQIKFELVNPPGALDKVFPKLVRTRVYAALAQTVRAGYVDWVIDFVVVAAFLYGLSIAYPELVGYKETQTISRTEKICLTVFLAVYALEMALKVVVLSGKIYIKSPWNKMDATLTLAMFFSLLYFRQSGPLDGGLFLRHMSMLRVLRLGRWFGLLPKFAALAPTLARVSPTLEWLVVVLFIFMYEFCYLGVQWYGGRITRDPSSEHYQAVKDLYYSTADYWPANFNDMPSGMTTLFIILVGSNWQLLVEAFCAVTSDWSRWYFYAWSLVGTALAMNLVVATIMDAFLLELEKRDEILKADRRSSSCSVTETCHGQSVALVSPRTALTEQPVNSITVASQRSVYVASLRARELYNVKDPEKHLHRLLSETHQRADSMLRSHSGANSMDLFGEDQPTPEPEHK